MVKIRPASAKARQQNPIARRVGLSALATLAVLLVVFGVARLHTTHTSISEQRYHTTPGQRSTIRLADGSTMLLAPASDVTITPAGVRVTGEAYFTIASHANRPFVVRTANAEVRVLGTRFSVRQYPNEPQSRVVVEDGRVMLSSRDTARGHDTQYDTHPVLSARMMAFVADSGITVSSGIATREYTSWTQGVLVFNRVALRDVVAELARAYGAEIQVDDSTLARRHMRLDVSVTDEPLSRVLDEICKVTEAHYTRDNATFIIAPGRVSRVPAGPSQGLPRHQPPRPEHQYGR